MHITGIEICDFILIRISCILIAVLLDLLLGDPVWMPHIVKAMGKNIDRIYKGLKRMFPVREGRDEDANLKLMLGQTIVIRMVFGNLLIFGLIFFVLDKYVPIAGLVSRVIVIYQCLSAKDLSFETKRVAEQLSIGGVNKGREALSYIVGRDTKKLGYEDIIRAGVETVAENTSDGVIAPLFYIFLFGALGGVVYKVVNTMDSMIGYHSDEFEYVGKTAAKCDDLLNYIPSRICAQLMILAAWICRLDFKAAKAVWKRDRKKSASPNSSQSESVAAGALNLRLLGPAEYGGVKFDKEYIGDDIKKPEIKDIYRTIKLMYWTEILALVCGFLISFAFVITGYIIK